MKKALISPNEPRRIEYSNNEVIEGSRVADVSDKEFEVASPLFWVDCNDDVKADQYIYDGNIIVEIKFDDIKPRTPELRIVDNSINNLEI